MDVKELNKTQLILLALLLSFVTSIATGITTVTLMQQAPSSITIPINRVVKQTVEKMVPVEGKNTVQTVIIKEEDLVVDAIEKNQPSLFSITKEVSDESGKVSEVNAGKGFAVSSDGVVAVDGSLVPDSNNVYYVQNSSGKFKTNFISLDKNGFALLRIGAPLDEKNKLSFTVPTFGELNKMKLGQKVLVLGDTLTSFMFDGQNVKINQTKSNAGGLVLDLDGNALGIALNGDTSFASIDSIKEALNSKNVKVEKPL